MSLENEKKIIRPWGDIEPDLFLQQCGNCTDMSTKRLNYYCQYQLPWTEYTQLWESKVTAIRWNIRTFYALPRTFSFSWDNILKFIYLQRHFPCNVSTKKGFIFHTADEIFYGDCFDNKKYWKYLTKTWQSRSITISSLLNIEIFKYQNILAPCCNEQWVWIW